MAVGMVFIRLGVRDVDDKDHHKVGHQVRQRVDSVGDQRVGGEQPADHHLGDTEQTVDDCADPGNSHRITAFVIGQVEIAGREAVFVAMAVLVGMRLRMIMRMAMSG